MKKINKLSDMGAIVLILPSDVFLHDLPDSSDQLVDPVDSIFFRVDGHILDNDRIVGISGRVFGSGCRFDGLICSAIYRCDGDRWLDWETATMNFKVGRTTVQLIEGVNPRLHAGTKLPCPYFSSYGSMYCLSSPQKASRSGLVSGKD